MNGLYALKPWYADRLSGVRGALARRRVSPTPSPPPAVAAAAAAEGALALLPAGWAAAPVALLLAVRLACANLDGALARDTGRSRRRGALLNEAGDRAADLLVIAAFWAVAPGWLAALAACAATLPSWVSLAGAAAGAPRLNGGPAGEDGALPARRRGRRHRLVRPGPRGDRRGFRRHRPAARGAPVAGAGRGGPRRERPVRGHAAPAVASAASAGDTR